MAIAKLNISFREIIPRLNVHRRFYTPYITYLNGQGAGNIFFLVGPILKRYYLPLTRIREKLVDPHDSQT